MAIYRNIHLSFWDDSFVLDLTPEEKYFFLYLMTNTKTTQVGIYELPKSIIQFQTGYNQDTVDKLLKKFIDYGKILYDESTKEIMLINWLKYNYSSSPKVISCIEKEYKSVKSIDLKNRFDTVCKEYQYSIDTQPQEEEEEEEEASDTDFERFWNLYDKKVGKEKSSKLFKKLSIVDIEKIFESLPAYIKNTPDRTYRKNPDTYLRNKCWLDEIIPSTTSNQKTYQSESSMKWEIVQ